MTHRGNHEPPPSVHHRRTIGAPLRLRLSPVKCARSSRVAAQRPHASADGRLSFGVRPPGLLRAARLRCWRTRLRRVHAARASPCKVRAFGSARGAFGARWHEAARPAASGASTGARACDMRTRRACRRTGSLRSASGGSTCGPPSHRPCCCGRRASAAGARTGGVRVRPAYRRAGCSRSTEGCDRGLASDCPGWCERRASASGARAGDVCTWRTRPFAGCLRFAAGRVSVAA